MAYTILHGSSASQAAKNEINNTTSSSPFVAKQTLHVVTSSANTPHPTHQIDDCASPETLQGNDKYGTSPSNCRLSCDTPVSIVGNLVYNTAAPPVYFPGPLHNMPGTAPQLLGPHWGVERVLKTVLDFLWGAWIDAREVQCASAYWCFFASPVVHRWY